MAMFHEYWTAKQKCFFYDVIKQNNHLQMEANSWEPLCYSYLHLGTKSWSILSSCIKAIKCCGHSAIIMDEEQKKAEKIIIMDNYKIIPILIAVLVKKKNFR